jgi:PAS domain S-box-containing protein
VWGTALGGLPFVLAYALPFAAGFDPWPRVEVLALLLGLVPLAFASAVVRYRLMDVEVIIKRGVTYAVAISAIAAIYAVILKIATEVFFGGSGRYNTVVAVLATLVVVLLAPMVKNAIQTTLDRAHYRDRYDYRRALVGFARDLNADLDLERLSARLVERVRQTLALERMALLIAPASGGGAWVPLHAEGFDDANAVRLPLSGGVGGRIGEGETVSLDDHLAARRFTAGEVDRWRTLGVRCFVPCVSKAGTIAVMALGGKESGEPLSSEDMELLLAVAGQVATALENGRLYHQLRVKADELHRLREFSENIIASLTEGLFVAGLDDRIVRWNPSLEGLYGLSRAAAVGRPIHELFDAPFVTALREAREGGSGSGTLYRVPLTSRHGEARSLLVNIAIAPLRTPEGAVAGTIAIVEDTTERVKLEEQLQISDKMASLGLLAAGVAHEVNTPLTGISSYTQMLLEGADPQDPRSQLLEKIEKQTFRAAKIVNGLLNLARPAQTDAGPLDVHVVLGDVLSLLEHQFKSGSIQLRKELAADPLVVQGVEHKLQQVFLNLFLNARDAMPKGGWLSISTRSLGDRALVELADTGSGIQVEHLSRIYDPFFSTKPIGKGTGLGLSITYGIVQEHNGTIACESTPGQGTRFVLTLPLAPAAARDQAGQIAH